MNPDQGGVCQGIRNTLPAMASLNCDNDVVCLDGVDDTFGVKDAFRVIRLGERVGPWAYSKKLRGWLRNSLPDYDAVVINGLWTYHSFAVTSVVSQLRREGVTNLPRVYVMPHGMLDPWFQRQPSRRLKAYRNWAYWKAAEHRTVRHADGLLFTCRKELELAREPFRPYRPKQEINVGYGVPSPPRFTTEMKSAFLEACPQAVNRPYLLFISRIHPKKGVDLLLRAYAEMAGKYKTAEGVPLLVVAGPCDSAYAEEMKELARQLGLWNAMPSIEDGSKPQVTFPGMLRGDAKWGAFYGCEAFVLPSHQENFGIAVVEALACGKPVLISNQVNIWDEIQDYDACLVEDDSQIGTNRLIDQWLKLSAEARGEMGQSALQCYGKNYRPESVAARFISALSGA
ncbi:D-inositol 3-phosphate glycosyltransferase [Stieleria magnilauensis]|uniref:D-inositol 3-phosphate glycosyltransferase n=2 Tax=Stieleria magnilauensis TaxID=2527963 RepID=A0ABX5XUK8_9BACT|nr:D-inositol 3-phosphate glycosyltransferase [Planctomycetes bacterium TBK1r]